MMKKILIALVGLLPGLLHAQTTGFSLKGTIVGLPDSTLVALYMDDVNSEPIAQSYTKKGAFTLTGSVMDPYIHLLTYGDKSKKAPIFLDNSSMTLTGDAASFPKVSVQGSSAQADFSVFNTSFAPMFERLQAIANQLNQQAPDPEGKLRGEYESLIGKIQSQTDAFIEARKTSYVAPFAAMVASQLNPEIAVSERRYQMLAPEIQKSYFGTLLAKAVAEARIGAIGSDAIDFVQNDTEGNPVSLSSFRGKYVLIDFWASWCRPCRMENPNVVKAYQQYKSKNFTVLGVSLDKTKDVWVKAIADDKLTWTHVSDLKFWSNEVAQKYKVESIPQNFLVSPDGKIIGKNLRGEELLQQLAQLIK